MLVPAWERQKNELRAYARRIPESTPLYQVVSAGRDKLERYWEILFERDYGALRFEVLQALDQFLECGVLVHGCAKIECTNPKCTHREALAFSCKRRCLCPSCDGKRAVIFAENLHHEVLLTLPHQHATLTIPKRIRPFFKFRRELISILYRCGWQAWKACVKELCPAGKSGAVMALHTAGDMLAWHCHLHVLVLAGALLPDGTFVPLEIDSQKFRDRFAEKVLAALLKEELLTQEIVDNMKSWPHSGFSAFLGEPIPADDAAQRLFVARYLKKCPVSNERLSLTAHNGDTIVTLSTVRDGISSARTFSVLEFLAELQMHLPDSFEQTSRFFGIYSSRSRGAEKEKPAPITTPYLPDASAKPSQKWAALMKRVFEIDPLICKRCGWQMKIKSFVTDPREVQSLINSLGLPAATAPPPLPICVPQLS